LKKSAPESAESVAQSRNPPEWMLRLERRALTEGTRSDATRLRRARAAIYVATIGVPTALVALTVLHYMGPISDRVYATLVIALVALAAVPLFLLRRFEDPRIPNAVQLWMSLGIIIYTVHLTGGPVSVALFWVPAVPVIAGAVGGARLMWSMTGAVAVWLVILTVLSASGHVFSQDLLIGPAFVPLLLAWAVFDTTLISMFSQRAYRRTFAELEASRTEIGEASTQKDLLLAYASHELRNPLSAMSGAVDLLELQDGEPVDPAYLAILRRSVDALTHRVEQMLNFARIQGSEVVLERKALALRELLREELSERRMLADEKGLSLVLEVGEDVPDELVHDAPRLRQLVANLVENALKYTEAGGVTVRAMLEVKGAARHLLIEVSDTGRGIEEEDRERVFEPFGRADGSGEATKVSYGLGLAICRELVAVMGGELGVESVVGEGSLFRARIPLGEALAEGVAQGVRHPWVKRRVLLVEDDAMNRAILTDLLELMGHEAVAADDGASGVEAFENSRFDTVLLDVRMPGINGLEAAQRMRALEAETGQAPTPIYAITANSSPSDEAACLAAGMDAMLVKPVSRVALEERLNAGVPPSGNRVSGPV
jgi:signal transduction histidine kinase